MPQLNTEKEHCLWNPNTQSLKKKLKRQVRWIQYWWKQACGESIWKQHAEKPFFQWTPVIFPSGYHQVLSWWINNNNSFLSACGTQPNRSSIFNTRSQDGSKIEAPSKGISHKRPEKCIQNETKEHCQNTLLTLYIMN